jgi:SAM-dependent methyltransferase
MTTDRPLECRVCGGPGPQNLGALGEGDFFAGRVLPAAIPGGRLWGCVECGSLFRHPILTAARYRRLYEGGAAGQWSGDGARRDFEVVRSVVVGAGAERVLDVGCGAGDFLASLPPTLERFGVEPSAQAAERAADRGLRIVAPTLEELPGDAHFDIITVIDVIEHVPQPATLLEQAFAHLEPGGLVVVSTGNPGHPAWRRRFRARFWYSSFPEHISFPSRQFYEGWARARGGEVESVTNTRYRTLPAWKAAGFWLVQVAYWVSPRLLDRAGRTIGALTRAPAPRRRHFSPAIGGVFADHWVVAIRRPS